MDSWYGFPQILSLPLLSRTQKSGKLIVSILELYSSDLSYGWKDYFTQGTNSFWIIH